MARRAGDGSELVTLKEKIKVRFDQLVSQDEIIERLGPPEADVIGLTYRSQDVKPGWLFAAIPGTKVDGHNFIAKAVVAGAVALIVRTPPSILPEGVAIAVVHDPRRFLAMTAARFYGHPSRKIELIGITGTNGKTTTAFLLESIFMRGGRKPVVFGTINYRFGNLTYSANVTTPESVELQSMLAKMIEQGADSGAMEVSSHALDQGRVWGLNFAARVFTNLSRDHLDYHGSMEEYFNAKTRFFTDAEFHDSGPAVINADDLYGMRLIGKLGSDSVSYGIENADATVRAVDLAADEKGVRMKIVTPEWTREIQSRLLGRINVYNILAAASAAMAVGIEPDVIKAGVEDLDSVPGRLEPVQNNKGIGVLVDYSHTPDALEKAMCTVREFTCGKLFVVFGCGGDRDRGKRPIMGGLAAKYADAAIVTSDNPRTEEPMSIIEQILDGVRPSGIIQSDPGRYPGNGSIYWVEPDRREAIFQAIGAAKEGDSVLIAGKGHEDYQIIKDKKFHFDDREAAKEALEK